MQNNFKSAIYEGSVRHRRFSPKSHEFTYTMFMMYLDLAELDRVFRGTRFWSARRFNLAWLRVLLGLFREVLVSAQTDGLMLIQAITISDQRYEPTFTERSETGL